MIPNSIPKDASNRYRLRRVGVAVALIVSALIVSSLLAVPIVFVLSVIGIAATGVTGYTVLIVEQQVVSGGVVLAYMKYIDSMALIRIRKPSIRHMGWVVVGVFVLLGISQGVGFALQQLGIGSGTNQITRIGREQPRLFLYLIPIAIVLIGPVEELLFRGGVQGLLRRSFAPVSAVILASALFGAVHIPAVIGADAASVGGYVLTTFLLGLVLGALYEHTNNLLVPALIHGVYNAVLFAVLYVFTVT